MPDRSQFLVSQDINLITLAMDGRENEQTTKSALGDDFKKTFFFLLIFFIYLIIKLCVYAVDVQLIFGFFF